MVPTEQVAYEAYAKRALIEAVVVPNWLELEDWERNAWRDAINAIS